MGQEHLSLGLSTGLPLSVQSCYQRAKSLDGQNQLQIFYNLIAFILTALESHFKTFHIGTKPTLFEGLGSIQSS